MATLQKEGEPNQLYKAHFILNELYNINPIIHETPTTLSTLEILVAQDSTNIPLLTESTQHTIIIPTPNALPMKMKHNLAVHRPQWESHGRKCFEDFVGNLPPTLDPYQTSSSSANIGITHLISKFLTYDSFSHKHHSFLALISFIHEPTTFSKAMRYAT